MISRVKGGLSVRSIGWISPKGGVGKSTCAVNVSVALAKRGSRVLVIDGDSQGNATLILTKGRGVGDGSTLFDVLVNEATVTEAIVGTDTPGLSLLPADAQLASADVLLASEFGRERRLRAAMKGIEGFDYVVVDTSPQQSLTIVNVLNFIDDVYCPVDPGIFALAGLARLQETIAGVVKFLDNPTLKLAGLVVSRTQRDNLSRDTETQLRSAFGDLVMKTTVPSSTKIGEAHARYTSVLDYAPGSPGAKAFEALTLEIIAHGAHDGIGDGVDGAAQTDRRGSTARRRRAS